MHFSWLVVWSVFSTGSVLHNILYITIRTGVSYTQQSLWLSWRWWRHKYLLILIPLNICVFTGRLVRHRMECQSVHVYEFYCSVAVIIFRSLQSLAAPCNCSGCSSCKSLILSFCKHFYLPGICRDFLRPWIWMFEPLFKCNNFVTTP